MFNVLGLVVEFGMMTALWFRHSREAIGEDDGGIWIEFYVFITSDFFHVYLGDVLCQDLI